MMWIIRFILLLFITSLACAHADTYGPSLKALFESYSSAYPEIQFLHVREPSDLMPPNDILDSLGNKARNIDYEHPLAARQTLLEAQAERIRLLLMNQMPSATLFETGSGSRFSKAYVCVVTLDESVFTAEPLAATRFFADDMLVNASARLKNEEALSFSLEHEIFHCLDAYVNGPLFRMTSSDITASYDQLRAEQRADLYAALMHRLRDTTTDQFLKNLSMFRTMSLVNWDLSHYTTPVLLDVMELDRNVFAKMGLRSRVQYSMQRAKQVVMTEKQYWDFVAAALEVSLSQGEGEGAFSPLFRELVLADRAHKPEHVAHLLAQVQKAKLFLLRAQVSSN